MNQAPNPDDFAVVIGINRYNDSQRCLTSPVNDAERVQQWLIHQKGGGLDPANCVLLRGDEYMQVTRELIEEQLIKARLFSKQQLQNGRPARRLYFYFSGHGLAKQADEVLMCHALWSADRPNANINSQELEKNYLNSCTWFDEVVVWLDCCRNRSLITKNGSLDVGCIPRDDGGMQKTMVAFATLDGSYAFEGLNEADENSVFTEALLQGLNKANNGNGQVSWRSLKAYLEEYVPVIAQAQNKPQRPQIDFLRLESDDDPVFGVAFRNSVTIAFDREAGLVTVFDQTFTEVVKDYDLATGALEFPFSIGRYMAICGTQRQTFSVTGVEDVIQVKFDE